MGEVVLANSRAVVAGFLILSSGVGLALGVVVFYRDSRARSLDRSPGRKYDREMPVSQSCSRASRSVICYECKKPGHMKRECSKYFWISQGYRG